MKKILVLEDDVMISGGLAYALETEGYEPLCAATVKDALALTEKNGFDLGILDMQLPDGRGMEVGVKLKKEGVPVIFLTVEDDEQGIVDAFKAGADDYVVKPFRIKELLARIERTVNRNDSNADGCVRIGSVKIDPGSGKVYAGEELIELTALEYRLLLIFANNKGTLLSRAKILDAIWDAEGNFVEDNTLTVYIKRLREKLGDHINIETVRGLGYRVDQ